MSISYLYICIGWYQNGKWRPLGSFIILHIYSRLWRVPSFPFPFRFFALFPLALSHEGLLAGLPQALPFRCILIFRLAIKFYYAILSASFNKNRVNKILSSLIFINFIFVTLKSVNLWKERLINQKSCFSWRGSLKG